MGKMNLKISDELEKRFRHAVAIHWGARKGVISKSVEEALELWIKSKSQSVIHGKAEIGWNGKDQY
ncbi:MAG: hypothetical protein ACRD47_04840 [Nitrososphaeraceae archaeon]